MARPFLVINLFYTLPLHPRLKGLGRLLALLRSLAYICLDIVLERHLMRIVSSIVTGLSIRSTKEKYRYIITAPGIQTRIYAFGTPTTYILTN